MSEFRIDRSMNDRVGEPVRVPEPVNEGGAVPVDRAASDRPLSESEIKAELAADHTPPGPGKKHGNNKEVGKLRDHERVVLTRAHAIFADLGMGAGIAEVAVRLSKEGVTHPGGEAYTNKTLYKLFERHASFPPNYVRREKKEQPVPAPKGNATKVIEEVQSVLALSLDAELKLTILRQVVTQPDRPASGVQ